MTIREDLSNKNNNCSSFFFKSMENPSVRRMSAELLLLILAILFGYRYVVIKDTIAVYNIYFVNMIRFGGASLTLLVFFRTKIHINKPTLIMGCLIGLLNFAYMGFQTYGLQYTDAGKGAFLTSTYIILIPIIVWLIFKEKPGLQQIFAAIICLVGIGLMSLNENLQISYADFTLIAASISCALCMIVCDKASKSPQINLLGICIIPYILSTVLFGIMTQISSGWPNSLTTESIWQFVYLSIICAGIGGTLFTLCIKYSNASRSAIIVASESVFATIFGIIFLNEILTARIILGALAIFGAAVLVVVENKEKLSSANKEKNSITI